MAKNSTGRTKLTSPVREQLNKMAAEARFLACGEAGCSAWGTKFAEIEDDAKEVGYEFIRLLMQQTADGSSRTPRASRQPRWQTWPSQAPYIGCSAATKA